MLAADLKQRSSRVPWPPILLIGTIGAGVAFDKMLPAELLGGASAMRAAGLVIVLAAVLLDAASLVTLHRHATTVLPHRGSTALVTTGPFALSRNPIYVGNILLTIGLALALANAWLLAGAVLEVALVRWLAILPEERHLEARFGDAWHRYRARTPRWIRR